MILLQESQLALIHIPLDLYAEFLQPILKLLLLSTERETDSETGTESSDGFRKNDESAWEQPNKIQPFINISVTPVECSIACPRLLAQELFVQARDRLHESRRQEVIIANEDYVVMQVDGEGLNAGQRVLELTSPLALAGMQLTSPSPIFFITTYFSDYILVPLRNRGQVIRALENTGFFFQKSASAYVSSPHHRYQSSNSSQETLPPPTPPPATLDELQTRTFATLKRSNVVPTVDPSIRLVHCGGRKDSTTYGAIGSSSSFGKSQLDDRFHLALVRCLVERPKFLSLTLTEGEDASLLLETRLLPLFDGPRHNDSALLGSRDDVLIPIMLDLRALPLESTGIVCGVAGRLVGGTTGTIEGAVEMTYLSTARAGSVMVGEDELERALGALRSVENGAVSGPD
ncbi:hypothetical protein M501DRAFT_928601 [Patellaria atrata CBS 101060]|uniref:CASTOR ACT domain-containing protein n=1 Tax=Patellaria atrata CBS 101060 TaxID=1346257 RepID=A0A9P4SGJ0_9PEZI|nr:hypothetical protein M501DRAFT_928601 [Patellaria atrata CBS 101060]